MHPREKSLLTVTCFGHFVSHFNMLVFPAVLVPLATRLALPVEETLGLSFFMYLLFGFSALPWGLAADRFGPRPLLALFFFGTGVCGLTAAASVDNPFIFSLSLAGIGLFSGIYHPAGLGWIAREVQKTSRAMAYNGMFGNLGLATAPLVAGLVNYYFGVKTVYLVLAGVNLVGLFFILGLQRHHVHKKTTSENRGQKRQSWQPFLILLVAMMLGGIVYRGTSVSLPAYFELSNIDLFAQLQGVTGGFGSANLAATLVTSCIYLVGMAGQFGGGRAGERFDLRWSYLAFHIITVPAALCMAISANWPLVAFATIHSFFLLGMQPIENTLVARYTPPRLLSSAYGTKFVLTFGVGALSVKIIELVQHQWSLSAVFVVLALVSLTLCLVIGVLIRATRAAKAAGT